MANGKKTVGRSVSRFGEGMLNPNIRMLYISLFTPPPEMEFDAAVGTTFSLDPTVLLELPVHLALHVFNRSNPDPVVLLASLRHFAARIRVYVQGGRIHVPKSMRESSIYTLLEKMIVEVVSPNQDGVFHPIIWVLRFRNQEQKFFYRLGILSRNITLDQSWDIALQLEGMQDETPHPESEALVRLIKTLPTFSLRDWADPICDSLAEDLAKVGWILPGGYTSCQFFCSGIEKDFWPPKDTISAAGICVFTLLF